MAPDQSDYALVYMDSSISRNKLVIIILTIVALAVIFLSCSVISNMKSTRARDTGGQSIKANLVYSRDYDISFFGLEMLHPFDSKKWGKVADELVRKGVVVSYDSIYHPEIKDKDLLTRFLTREYLEALQSPAEISRIVELIPLRYLPLSVSQTRLLTPMLLQTHGSILATRLALEKKTAVINIGGGFHHANKTGGGGFCVYPDITLCVMEARRLGLLTPVDKVMIIDLDAHQGNGHEFDFIRDQQVTIIDFFRHPNYPGYPADHPIVKRIDYPVLIGDSMTEDEYLKELTSALNTYNPLDYALIIYNAGTDILDNDPLGRMNISESGIIKRDQMVFEFANGKQTPLEFANNKQTPLVMLTSGGYTGQSYQVIANSIANLHHLGLIN